MRNAEALQRQFGIQREVGPEIRSSSLRYSLLNAIDRQRLARFGQVVRDPLELGEHRLPEDRAADGVDLAIDQKGPLAVVAGRGIRCRPSNCSLNVLATSATKIV